MSTGAWRVPGTVQEIFRTVRTNVVCGGLSGPASGSLVSTRQRVCSGLRSEQGPEGPRLGSTVAFPAAFSWRSPARCPEASRWLPPGRPLHSAQRPGPALQP